MGWEQGLSNANEGECVRRPCGVSTRPGLNAGEAAGEAPQCKVLPSALRVSGKLVLRDPPMPGAGGALGRGVFLLQRTFQKASMAGITSTGGQLILPLSSGLLSQLPVPGYGPRTANPRRMPGPLPLIWSDGCAGLEEP